MLIWVMAKCGTEVLTSLFREVPFEPKADNIAAVDVALGGGRDDSEIPEAKHGEAAETLPRQEDRR